MAKPLRHLTCGAVSVHLFGGLLKPKAKRQVLALVTQCAQELANLAGLAFGLFDDPPGFRELEQAGVNFFQEQAFELPAMVRTRSVNRAAAPSQGRTGLLHCHSLRSLAARL